ncbi:MAG: hypothetical protein ACSLE1_08355 [Sphingobium sp.]
MRITDSKKAMPPAHPAWRRVWASLSHRVLRDPVTLIFHQSGEDYVHPASGDYHAR